MPPRLPYVRYQTTRGKVYAYFNTGRKGPNGRPLYAPLPSPSSASFYQSYAAFKAAREKRTKPAYTFANMVRDYQASDEHASKSAGTRKSYKSILLPAVDLLGHFPVALLDRAAIQTVLDAKPEWGPGKRNLFVAAIGAVYAWGRDRGKTDASPSRGIRVWTTGEHKPWPDDVLAAGLAAEGRVGLAIALMLYTGQRIGDVCAMRWSAIKGGSITVTQQKTGKRLVIPLHAELRAILDQQSKKGLSILTAEDGQPVSTQGIRREIKALVKAAGHPGLLPHGLRKNAVIALLRHRCSVAEVAAVTGQTYALVEYYARQIDQEKMAEAAILRWEQNAPVQRVLQTPPQVIGK